LVSITLALETHAGLAFHAVAQVATSAESFALVADDQPSLRERDSGEFTKRGLSTKVRDISASACEEDFHSTCRTCSAHKEKPEHEAPAFLLIEG
jgi:hypothetical protein